jgi:hypothetical protein
MECHPMTGGRMSQKSTVILFLPVLFSSLPAVAQVKGPPEKEGEVKHDKSEELRHIHPISPGFSQRDYPVYHLPHSLTPDSPDPVAENAKQTMMAIPLLCSIRRPVDGS